MRVDEDAINRGVENAFQRTRQRFEINERRILDSQYRLVEVLESWPGEADPRFVTLFAELWAIAEVARLANGEPKLVNEEIRDFLGHCFAYFNSFKHK